MDCIRFNAKSSQTWVVKLSAIPAQFAEIVHRANKKDVKVGKTFMSEPKVFVVCWPKDEQKCNVLSGLDTIINGDARAAKIGEKVVVESILPLDLFHAEEWGLVPCFDDPHERRFRELRRQAKSKQDAARSSAPRFEAACCRKCRQNAAKMLAFRKILAQKLEFGSEIQ